MHIFGEAALALAVCAALAALISAVKNALLSARRSPSEARAVTVILARGEGDGLEGTVRCRAHGETDEIVIADCGLSAQGRLLADALARRYGASLCGVDHTHEDTEAPEWTKTND